MRLTRDPRRPPARQAVLVLVIGGLSAALWYGWFAWNTEYQDDPATGRMAGPYAVWQGVAAFLCIGAVLVGFGSTAGAAVMLGLAATVDAVARRIRRSPSTHT